MKLPTAQKVRLGIAAGVQLIVLFLMNIGISKVSNGIIVGYSFSIEAGNFAALLSMILVLQAGVVVLAVASFVRFKLRDGPARRLRGPTLKQLSNRGPIAIHGTGAGQVRRCSGAPRQRTTRRPRRRPLNPSTANSVRPARPGRKSTREDGCWRGSR